MNFWSGETLLEKLPGLIQPFSSENIDCAAYTLTIGREVYVSPTDETLDPKSKTKRHLADGEAFTIPPGQFAFLLTEEMVSVPADAIAFISIRARIKFRGLVNVSGFHVDPGFRGRLIFSVFNAGPVTVHLQQGQQIFLIWYASLDRVSEKIKREPVQETIPLDLINSISGELQSLEGLSRRIKEVEKSLSDRMHAIERAHAAIYVVASIAIAILIGLVVNWIGGSTLFRSVAAPSGSVAAPTVAAPSTPAAPGTAPSTTVVPAQPQPPQRPSPKPPPPGS